MDATLERPAPFWPQLPWPQPEPALRRPPPGLGARQHLIAPGFALPGFGATADTVAIMQPYLFPYLGYFALVAAADTFVFYDDVHYIPRGWINRNRILINGAPHTFTLPVADASQNRLILEVRPHDFPAFRGHLLRQLQQAYRRAPYQAEGLALVERVLDVATPTVAELATRSVQLVAEHLGLRPRFLRSSVCFADSRGAPRAERLIRIARELGAGTYVNAPGGAALYTREEFAAGGLALRLVQPELQPYAQGEASGFVPGLSVIDALMHCPVARVAALVKRYHLD